MSISTTFISECGKIKINLIEVECEQNEIEMELILKAGLYF